MEPLVYLLDIIKLIIAGLAVFLIGWFLIKEYLDSRYNSKLIDLKKSAQAQTLPLRLQAYERMVIFLERLNPTNMLVRLHVSDSSVRELQHLVLSDIRAEYQHNIAQQLYVSTEAWQLLKQVKEDTISLMNNAARSLPPDAPSVELSKVVLTHLSSLEENPYDTAVRKIKGELYHLF